MGVGGTKEKEISLQASDEMEGEVGRQDTTMELEEAGTIRGTSMIRMELEEAGTIRGTSMTQTELEEAGTIGGTRTAKMELEEASDHVIRTPPGDISLEEEALTELLGPPVPAGRLQTSNPFRRTSTALAQLAGQSPLLRWRNTGRRRTSKS